MSGHVLWLLLLIGIIRRVKGGKRRIDLWRTRRGHVRRRVWDAVVLVVHRHDAFAARCGVEVVLKTDEISRSGEQTIVVVAGRGPRAI